MTDPRPSHSGAAFLLGSRRVFRYPSAVLLRLLPLRAPPVPLDHGGTEGDEEGRQYVLADVDIDPAQLVEEKQAAEQDQKDADEHLPDMHSNGPPGKAFKAVAAETARS